MYWPTMLNPKGGFVKHISVKKNKGVKVKTMCTSAEPITILGLKLRTSPIPMHTSHPASKRIVRLLGKMPNIKWFIVPLAKLSAGLKLGKNLRAPNQT